MQEKFKYFKWAAGGSAQFFLFEKKLQICINIFLENKLTYAGTIQIFKGGGRRLCPILFLKILLNL
jgi:hypothetical protein